MAWPASSSTKLKCYVSGDSPLKYQWYKDGKKLLYRRLDPKINTSLWTLRLRELVPSDSGVYTCVVSNRFGVFRHNITLKVIGKQMDLFVVLINSINNFLRYSTIIIHTLCNEMTTDEQTCKTSQC